MPRGHRDRPVAMITHSYYEEDPRVRREAEALVAIGHPVDVIALRGPGADASAVIDGVRVIRMPVQRHQGAGLVTYLREYVSFFLRSGWRLAREHRSRHYALVQVHSLPDFLAFAALPTRLAGTPLLLDLHEAMPEFFRTRFPAAASRPAHAALVLQERLSIAIADHVLTVNDSLRGRLVEMGVRGSKVTVIPNAPSLARFDPTTRPVRTFAEDGVLRLAYAGALTPTYEVDVAIEAVARLAEGRPGLAVALDIYGRGDSGPALEALATSLGVASRVRFHGRIPIDAVPDAVARADIGLAPTRRTSFTDFSLSTKILEYAAMGKPVICSHLPLVGATFPAGTAWTYEPGDAASLASSIEAIVDDPTGRAAAVARTLDIVRDRAWERESSRYIAIVERLADFEPAGSSPATIRRADDGVGDR